MKTTALILVVAFATLTSVDRVLADSQVNTKPNVIVIYADDLGYGDVKCYNRERGKIATPHIDKLAAEGMKFTDAHSSSGVCSPSRYTLLTGRYHWRSRLQKGIVGLWQAPLIPTDRLTIGGLAKKHGYSTACIGKWHLGWNWNIAGDEKRFFVANNQDKKNGIATAEHKQAWENVFSKPISGGPTAVGFDQYFGTDVPNWPPYCFIENNRTVGIPSEYAAPALFEKNQASKQGPALEGWTLEPILPALGNRTAAYIRQQAAKEQPFLVYMPLTSPHTPLSVNEKWKGKSGLNLYADFVMETDAIVGQVMDAIDESGITNNTLVVFTSDNGCAHYIGISELEKMGHFPSGPLRGSKSDVWEGGHRVPFIVRWPGIVASNTTSEQLVHQADLIATLADIMEDTLPENSGEDSFSLLPILKGNNRPVRQHAVSTASSGVPGFRLGSWKYIPDKGSGGWGKGGDQSQPIQLYNLADDLAESNNLAAEMPERVADLKTRFEKVITNGRSTPGQRQRNDMKVVRFPRK